MRLSRGTLAQLPFEAVRPGYAHAEQAVGIVHFGIGAFHRAHQAWYVDRAMAAGDRNWSILGVSLRSDDVASQLNPQDGLYTVTERSEQPSQTRVIGAVRGVCGPAQGAKPVVHRLASADTRIVSFTVTEKGYCRLPDGGLDFERAGGPGAFYGMLAAGLKARRDARLPGLTLLSCDNLAHNGRILHGMLMAYLERYDAQLSRWVERECAFPSTMVDRIVPATTVDDLTLVAARLGLEDRGAVLTEPFSQWVIEDRFAGPRPRLEQVGAELVTDVEPYETAKLRMLNGAHSALAYLGLERGHSFVHEAVADPVLRGLVEQLMRIEAAGSFAPAPGQDLATYADRLLARFANPALRHKLAQIAMDGSQKIPQRWLATLSTQRSRGQDCPAILAAAGAWLRRLRNPDAPLDDPMATALRAAATGVDWAVAAMRVFGPGGLVASDWTPSAAEIAQMQDRPA
ncbi:MAG: mannitol dehydrogenase family protein [Sphingobium sp.]|nr:mannitol dehydrogenase family protein [Sphingobium sp.]